MQFNSISFLFCFLPLMLAAYYIFPHAGRNVVLILGSLVFYAFAGSNTAFTLGTLFVLALCTFFVSPALTKPRRGWLLGLVLGVYTVVLAFFKCYEGGKYLPAGMSFYLFQLAAYLIAVFTGRIAPDTNVLQFGTQVTMFPKLLSGPLMDPADLQSQVRMPEYSLESFHRGLQLLILGLGMKVIVANRVGGLFGQAGALGYDSISTPLAWLALIAYSMQLFLDFWGYSLMAMGLGKMLGFHLPENFLDPYASKSVSEFYRRWHATLGAWFRENVYFPMGGSRKGTFRTVLNLLVVWLLTGLWHGIGGNYLIWAGILVFFIILERLFLRKLLDRSHVLCHVYTVFVIVVSWLPFAVGDWGQMCTYFGRLFGMGGQVLNPQDYLIWGREYLWLLVAGAVLATPLPRMLWSKIKDSWVTDIVLLVLFWITVYFIATSAQDPFMYFQY